MPKWAPAFVPKPPLLHWWQVIIFLCRSDVVVFLLKSLLPIALWSVICRSPTFPAPSQPTAHLALGLATLAFHVPDSRSEHLLLWGPPLFFVPGWLFLLPSFGLGSSPRFLFQTSVKCPLSSESLTKCCKLVSPPFPLSLTVCSFP